MHVTGHNTPCIEYESFVLNTIGKTICYDIEIDSSREQVYPMYGRITDKVGTLRVMEFIFPAHIQLSIDECLLLLSIVIFEDRSYCMVQVVNLNQLGANLNQSEIKQRWFKFVTWTSIVSNC